MIEDCLGLAHENKLNTVAFPTVGCGALKYPVSDVIHCFKDAATQFPAVKVLSNSVFSLPPIQHYAS